MFETVSIDVQISETKRLLNLKQTSLGRKAVVRFIAEMH